MDARLPMAKSRALLMPGGTAKSNLYARREKPLESRLDMSLGRLGVSADLSGHCRHVSEVMSAHVSDAQEEPGEGEKGRLRRQVPGRLTRRIWPFREVCCFKAASIREACPGKSGS